MYHFETISLNHVVLYEEVSSLDMLGFLVVLRVVRKVDRTFIVTIERRSKRVIVVVSLPQISRQLLKSYC
jgi:hypothetical protein